MKDNADKVEIDGFCVVLFGFDDVDPFVVCAVAAAVVLVVRGDVMVDLVVCCVDLAECVVVDNVVFFDVTCHVVVTEFIMVVS